jgi:hypothetical protein
MKMSYKVFLFDNDNWLYCEDVTFEDGVYHGRVINGNWHLMYDTKLEGWFACRNREAADSLVAVTKGHRKLTWVTDPYKPLFNYNDVLEEAKERYKAGEPANFELKEEHVIEYDDEYDDVPF